MAPKSPIAITIVEVIMYASLRKIFPARAVHTPPFRSCGMPGDRLLTAFRLLTHKHQRRR
nr:MAG TPA: hypothetical protein [Caudoviricetes sp.]